MAKGIILAIKPRYADSIYKMFKQWEYRKAIYPLSVSQSGGLPERMGKIWLYESSPVKMITGYIIVDNFIWNQTLDQLWEYTKDYAGITKEEFLEYYKGSKEQCAWHIKDSRKLIVPTDPKKVIPNWHAPQFYRYVDEEVIRLY